MKRIFATVLIFAATVCFVNASEPRVPTTVMQAFQSRFAQAQNVSWKHTEAFDIVAFTLAGRQLSAYYLQNGNLHLLAEQIFEKDLPKALQAGLKAYCGQAQQSAIFKVEQQGVTSYSVYLKNEKGTTVLKAVGTEWQAFSK